MDDNYQQQETPLENGYRTNTRPTPVDPLFKPKHTIVIEQLLVGFIVRVGCQSIAFENADFMLAEIGRFLKDPKGVQEEYIKKGA